MITYFIFKFFIFYPPRPAPNNHTPYKIMNSTNKKKGETMETIQNINQEFNLNNVVENEKVNLTLDMYNAYLEGALSEELTDKINSYISDETEYYITDYFHYNNLLLIDEDIKVYLTSNLRPQESIFENIRIEIKDEYNLLQDYLNADLFDYTNKLNSSDYNYNSEYYTILEILDYLTYTINAEYLQDCKDQITSKDIINIISFYVHDKDFKEYIRQADYIELIEDIKDAYKQQINRLKEDIEEALQEKYIELINNTYINALDNIRTELIQGYDITL